MMWEYGRFLFSVILIAFTPEEVFGGFKCKDKKLHYYMQVCIPEGYDSFALPSDDVTNLINIRMDVDEVLEINEKENTITFSGYFNVDWNENRLVLDESFQNEGSVLKPVEIDILEDLWKPNVFIYNLMSFEVITVLSPLSGVWISGTKNVLYSQAVRIKLLCPMTFSSFPFDSQVCKFRAGSYSYKDSRMRFQMEAFKTYGGKNILPFKTATEALSEEEKMINYGALGNFSIAGMQFVLTRHSAPYITSYYFPSGVLVLISLTSLLISNEDVLSKLILLLVPLLCLVLMNLSSSASSLVPVNHITSLQVWLLCCIILVLLPLIQLTAILMMKAMNKEIKDVENVNKKTLIIFIFTFINFVFAYGIIMNV